MRIVSRIKILCEKDARNIIDKISKKTGKSKICLFLDIFKSYKNYKCDYMEYYYYEFYMLSDKERRTFVTNKMNDYIINKYNNKDESIKLDDKGSFDLMFKDYIHRDFIDLRSSSFKDFKDFISDKDKVLVSTTDYKNFEIIRVVKDLLKNEYNVLKIYNSIMKRNEVIVEELLVENKEVSRLYSEGINYLRLNTFNDGKDVHVISRVFKINKSKDEKLYAILNENGTIIYPAVNNNSQTFMKHPDTKEDIIDYQVPFYKEAEKMVIDAAKKINDVKYIGWDVFIGEDHPSILKATSKPLAFELKPSVSGNREGLKKEYEKYIGEKL